MKTQKGKIKMACSYGIEQPCSECRMCEQTKEINTDKEKQEFNQNKCDKIYHASCLADTNCKDSCDMKCEYENKAEKTNEYASEDMYDKFMQDVKQLSETYGISENRAYCYLCNYGDNRICEYQGIQCKCLEQCKQIELDRRKAKHENAEVISKQTMIQEAVTNLKNLFSQHELTLPNTDSLKTLQVILQAIEELEQYRMLGTIEELQSLIEAQAVEILKDIEQDMVDCGEDVKL